MTVTTVLTYAHGSLTTRHLIYRLLVDQVTIYKYIDVAYPPPPQFYSFKFSNILAFSVTVPTERYLTYARLLRALCIRLSFSPFFLYIASSSPFTPLVPYLQILNIRCSQSLVLQPSWARHIYNKNPGLLGPLYYLIDQLQSWEEDIDKPEYYNNKDKLL